MIDRAMQRLEIGRERYGLLDLSQPRDWRRERFEERLDALVYDVCEELAAEDLALGALREAARDEMLGIDSDEAVREWSEQGTVISGASAAIARTVSSERSDPYETVVVDVDGGERR